MAARGQISESAGTGRMVRPVLISVVFGVIVCAVILLLLAFVVTAGGVPQSAIDPMAIFALSAGAFTTGFSCAKIIRRNGLLCGLLCGVIFSIVVLLASFAVPDNIMGLASLLKILFMLLASMLGGVLGINTKRRKK